ncbi:MAG: hypothetical protein M3Y79_04775 [Pseudomonadota bacterium]|nr:hypothetical protein [Pseudomonadota bacterium]
MKLKIATIAMSAVLAGPVFGCTEPDEPAAIPNGRTASKEQMLATKKAIDKYKRDVENYLACEADKQRVLNVQADLERVANRFNLEVRAFKAVNGG